ncbi:MMPL family transporter [Nannocystis punicea]|uniref:MMPL family transporter n=1 Tax=Nannocystis punicea TaxID=2995304 RepID=A0ABY7GZQ5_9BACT|nr:MMPL family transporter [Nannocystis poenicansa]WAS92486.1 MMPL family transporter [Nannocystis poenicansa]
MPESLPQRIFNRIANLSLGRPRLVLTVAGLLVVGSAVTLPQLRVSTSRYGLVSDTNPDQARMLRFFERFGNPDAPVVVVSGDSVEARRAVVDRLIAGFEAVPELHGRVLARVGPSEVAEVLLLQRPEILSQVTGDLPPDVALAPLVEGGLPAWFGAIEGQLQAGLDGEAAPQDPARAAEGLKQLGGMAGTFDRYLAGEDLMRAAMQAQAGEAPVRGRDEAGYIQTVDGKHHVVSVFPEFLGNEVSDFAPLMGKIREVRDEALAGAPAGVSAAITGLPALASEEQQLVSLGLIQSSVWSGVAIVVLCLVMLRSLRQTVLALVPLLAGLALTLGAVYWIYGYLNLITSSFVSTLLGLGIDFGVHMMHRFNEQRRAGSSVAAAIREALVHTGPPILVGALVTVLAFLTTLGSDFTAYAELGVITAIGLVFVVLATVFVLPSLLILAGKTGLAAVKKEPPMVHRLVGFVARARVFIVVLAVLAAVGGGWGLSRIAFNGRYFDFLPRNSEGVQALESLEGDPLMSPVYANVAADDVESARQKAEALRALPEVAGVQTATDLLPPLDEQRLAQLKAIDKLGPLPDFAKLAARKSTPEELLPKVKAIVDALDEVRFAMQQGGQPTEAVDQAQASFRALRDRLEKAGPGERERLAAAEPQVADLLRRAWTTGKNVAERGRYAPEDLPQLFRTRFVARDGGGLALFVVPAVSPWESQSAEAFRDAVTSVSPDASGLAINIELHSSMIVAGFRRAALWAALLILVVVTLDLRSLRDGALALVPTVLGWLWMLGLMAAVGRTFDVANIVSLPLVIGIGTAFGVHLMHRCQESESHNSHARLDDLVRGTGSAVVLSALTTIASFASLTLSDYGGMKSFGSVMVMGISSCLLASLLVLPALLLMSGRVRVH